jgi:hypothetical protein
MGEDVENDIDYPEAEARLLAADLIVLDEAENGASRCNTPTIKY